MENRVPHKPVLGVCLCVCVWGGGGEGGGEWAGGGALGASASPATRITSYINETETLIFVFYVSFVSMATFIDFICLNVMNNEVHSDGV